MNKPRGPVLCNNCRIPITGMFTALQAVTYGEQVSKCKALKRQPPRHRLLNPKSHRDILCRLLNVRKVRYTNLYWSHSYGSWMIDQGYGPQKMGTFIFALEMICNRTLELLQDSPKRRRIYVLHNGYVISKNDGQRHYIGPERVRRLYNAPLKSCMLFDDERLYEIDLKTTKLVHLYPQSDGRYHDVQKAERGE